MRAAALLLKPEMAFEASAVFGPAEDTRFAGIPHNHAVVNRPHPLANCCASAGCCGSPEVGTEPRGGARCRPWCECRCCRAVALGAAIIFTGAPASSCLADSRDQAPPVYFGARLVNGDNAVPAGAAEWTSGYPGLASAGTTSAGKESSDPDHEETAAALGMTYIGTVGWSNVDNQTLSGLQAGAHEPQQNGLPLHLLTLSGRARAGEGVEARASIMVRATENDPSQIEVEEAYLLIGDHRWKTRVKAGSFFTEFGKLNGEHFEDSEFIDKPVILSRLFGEDQLSNPGISVSWRPGDTGDSKLIAGVQSSTGETAVSYLAEAGDEIAGHTLRDRSVKGASDLLYHARATTAFRLPPDTGMEIGASIALGPNSSGLSTRTAIVGLDVGTYWYRQENEGDPTVHWHNELLLRRYEAGDSGDPGHEILKDRGMVSQMTWRIDPGWLAGLRLEYANGNGDNQSDPERDRRVRASVNTTWSPVRWLALRAQFNHDAADHLEAGPARSVWFQIKISAGDAEHHEN